MGSGKSLAYITAALASGKRVAVLTESKGLQDQICVSPDTRVLGKDLVWRLAGDFRVGDSLVGFDENRTPARRMWRESYVTDNTPTQTDCYRIEFEDGTVVVCSAAHKWLCRKNGTGPEWIRTDRFHVGKLQSTHVLRLLDIWNTSNDYRAGYLAAAFDGEGHLHQSGIAVRGRGADVNLSVCQSLNPMLDSIKSYLKDYGFGYHSSLRTYGKSKGFKKHWRPAEIIGLSHRRDILRFLGQIRPVRLLPKLDLSKLGMIGPVRPIRVVSCEKIGKRDVVPLNTTTKTFVAEGLASHNCKDFGGIGLYDMRGLANYTCRAMAEGGHLEAAWNKRWGRPTCEMGPCTAGLRCDLKNDGCEYFDSYKAAYSSQLVSTNYAYWIAIHKYGEGLGKFDMLVCDEAHAADAQLSSALSVEFDARDVRELKSKPPKADSPLQNWRMWARVQLQRVQGKLDFYTKGAAIGQTTTAGTNGFSFVLDTDIPDASELKFWKKLEGKCKTLSESTDDWVIEMSEDGHHTRIAPVWVRNYAETHLFLSIPRIVMMSATVRPKIEDLLGMNEKQCEFKEYPSTFPVSRRPIYWIPTVRLNYNTESNDLKTWAVRIDQIIARRLHWKGIIHTRCVEPKTKILTANLDWVRADSICRGDSLLGFDEFPSKGKGGSRSWRSSIVEEAEIIQSDCLRVTMVDGTSIVCSKDHLWLTHNGVVPKWIRSCDLIAGKHSIMRVIDTWKTGTDWDSGYLAAAYDGEGHLYQKKYKRVKPAWKCRSLCAVFSQNRNVMLDTVKVLLNKKGFKFSEYGNKGRKIRRINIAGKASVLRFLGEIRPKRLVQKLDIDDLGKIALKECVSVSSVEDVGMQDVVFIRTSTRTFIAEGFASHNSYERQRYLKEHSRFRDIMFANTAGNTRDVVQSFRDAKAPAILVSPSVGTGFDFPHDAARYQIIGKVPFRDARGAILKAQAEEDPDYLNYLTAQDLIQTYGRSNRAPDDFSETFIVDDSIEWFLSRYAGYWYDREAGRFDMTRRKNGKIDLNYFPFYFLEAFQRINSVPDPPELELIALAR